jgi:multisubunit Na+/H+ antiporter MnhF subunit
MSALALVLLSVAAALFLTRLFIGPSVADRVMAFDGLLITVMCGILVAVARRDWSTSVDAVLLIALVGFIGTGVLARFVERRGG